VIQDYGFRIYNPSIGKFLSVDPLTKSYPFYTPYQFAANTPIQAIDLDGLEAWKKQWWEDFGDRLVQNLTGAKDLLVDIGTTAVNNPHKVHTGAFLAETETAGKLAKSFKDDPVGTSKRTIVNVVDQVYNSTPQGTIENIFREDGGKRMADNTTEAAFVGAGKLLSVTKLNKGTVTLMDSGKKIDNPNSIGKITLKPDEQAWVSNYLDNLPPVSYGIAREKALSSNALRVMADGSGGEIMQIFIRDGNTSYYKVVRGTINEIEVNMSGGTGTPYLINHVHPSGNKMPSNADINVLSKFQEIQRKNGQPIQKSSQIIPAGVPNSKFNTDSKTKG